MKFIFNKLKAIIHSGKSYKSKVSGFSLLELLVVISIIAVLLALGISSFNTAQKKARDAKRKNDVKDVSSALEQYYSVCGSLYPTPAGASFYTSIVCGRIIISHTCWGKFLYFHSLRKPQHFHNVDSSQ